MREIARQAFTKLAIPTTHRAILCLDGGGIRGIMTLQLLKALEAYAGAPCHQIFDMVAGTSTGAIIAGLIASGRSAVEVDELYEKLVTKVFVKHGIFSNQFIDPPAWSKISYRKLLKELLGDITLRQVGQRSGLDLMITAHDVAEGEETFFSYLSGRKQNAYGDVLLRGAMEATMSAPTYFTPFERFVDGGTTTYNNPSLAAMLEAVQYGEGSYSTDKLCLYSFGTACRTQLISPRDVPNPPGPDIAFWLSWLMTESGNDASDMQSDLLRSHSVLANFDYRRFQLSLDKVALAKLPDLGLEAVHATDAQRLSELTDRELASIQLDNVSYFPVMRAIGEGFVAFLRDHAEKVGKALFSYDLVTDEGKELLVTRSGDVAGIAAQLGDPEWIDRQPF